MRRLVLVFILLATFPVYASFPSVHLIVAKEASSLSESNWQAFALGVGTHALLDVTVEERFREVIHGNSGVILAEGLLLWLALRDKPTERERWAMWGAITPGLIDGVYALIYPDRWQKGQLLIPWHVSW